MIRVGMVGAGNFATVHLRALAQEPDVEIVGHVSASGQRAQANALAYGGSAFAGVEAFVDEAHPDAVWICTPPAAHGPIEEVLIRRKIPFSSRNRSPPTWRPLSALRGRSMLPESSPPWAITGGRWTRSRVCGKTSPPGAC